MKSKIVFSVLMVAGLFFATSTLNNVSAQTAKTKAKTEVVKAKKYYCPHHPDQISDKPGKCPVCGMAMVEMKDMGKTSGTKTMKMDKMKTDKSQMKGDMKKNMDKSKMMKDSKGTKMDMKMDTAKVKKEKM